ncbi:OmpA family protein [Pseudidiomarina sp.]|uniref:OmpA family protein n=1 Tax=Pseudidiomarina sp. TaxID=2081707 RepID=UPI00299DFA16|nr:OmpA family protein [Pseudidiomarina sp.]MDX1705960.1 OmpA family protein [Pseudidiomarina sp.]
MKQLTALSVAVLAACSAVPAMAQDNASEVGQVFVGPRIGLFGTDSDRLTLKDGQIYKFEGGFDSVYGGIEAGFLFTPKWGYRIYYDYLRGSMEGGDTASGDAFGVDVLYNFTENFYGGLGISSTELGSQTNRFLRVTGGYKQYVTNNMALTIEGGLQQSDEDLTEFLLQTGVRWYFDTPAKYTPAPAPVEPQQQPVQPPVDSDGDGVLDSNDKCPDTQAGYKVDADGCVMFRDETITKTLMVTFGFDSAQIPAGQDSDIRSTANFLKDYPQLNVVIEGHTDDLGPESYNLKLSQERAKAVGDSLVDFGIDKSRVSTVGYGETQPLVPNTTKANRAENRRVEAKMSVTKKTAIKD